MVKRRTRSRRRRGGGFMSPQQAKEAGMTVTWLEDISTLRGAEAAAMGVVMATTEDGGVQYGIARPTNKPAEEVDEAADLGAAETGKGGRRRRRRKSRKSRRGGRRRKSRKSRRGGRRRKSRKSRRGGRRRKSRRRR